jgi:hypothetical protein
VGWALVIIVVLLLGSTPWYIAEGWLTRTRFTEDQPHKFLSSAHHNVIDALESRAGPGDVLVADQPTLRWLAPEYPGLHYAGHFFLTTNFASKRDSLAAFWLASPEEQAAFLHGRNARWLFVPQEIDPLRFEAVPGLRPVIRERVGTLFEFATTGSPS